MTISTSLTIKQISKNNNQYSFDCVGSIDAHATPAFSVFSGLPAEASVTLDFSNIERVNSMGLSLLLKLFEEWERNSIRVEVENLNRMVSMLFKITGLGRFVKGATDQNTGTSGTKMIDPAPPAHLNKADTDSETSANKSKLNFVASLQTGSQLSGWYLLNTYLQRRMQKVIHFEQAQDVKNITPDILFSKPFEACAMMKKGFIPLMRPIAEADEVVILSRSDDKRTLSDMKNVNVVTATEASFVYLLGRFLCDESGVDSSKLTYHFAGNEIKALQMLIRKQADLLFVLKKTYENLSSLSRNSVQQLDASDTNFTFHLFSIAPHLQLESDALGTVLEDMKNDEQGKQILQDLQFQGWCKPEQDELNMLKMVFDRYVEN
jgi:anti-anti-sigma factor